MDSNKPKSLSDYKEEIHKCSKCGLCQAVCPLFQTTGNECSVSRGQFIMLDGVVKGKLKLNKNINKYLDLCLKCNKCSEFCPSEINVVDILLSAKHEYFKNSIQGKIYSFLESKPIFNTTLTTIKILSNIFSLNIIKKKQKKYPLKAIYFGGCISALKPKVNNYVINLLNKIGIEVLPIDFNCCGMPFLTTGNKERFIEQAIENIKKLPENCDMIITDCASCEWSWQQYSKYVEDTDLINKLEKIKIKDLYDLICENDLKFESKKELKITYHKPCHTKKDTCDKILNIIKNIQNTTYTEMEGYDNCCGFASYEHPQTLSGTKQVRKRKQKSITHTKSDFVITNCVGCLTALKLMEHKTKTKPRRLISFLKDNCKIKPKH